ncbi:hypothetical protein [Cumulibacter soli]|uniref:hypothetical protein n=1 Tax=Cumulibacter soli TaxID=2546344 RepID=UPI001068CCAC|nr:hypothetical protein [Cumulibacter soli]
MPARALAITSRHHPVAVACYLGVAILAVLYLTDVAAAASLTDETSGVIAVVWQVALLVGSGLALVGVAVPARHLLHGLALEALGAMIVGVELGVYAVVMWSALDGRPWASITMFSAVALGSLTRSVTAMRDRRRVVRAAAAMQLTTALADAE